MASSGASTNQASVACAIAVARIRMAWMAPCESSASADSSVTGKGGAPASMFAEAQQRDDQDQLQRRE